MVVCWHKFDLVWITKGTSCSEPSQKTFVTVCLSHQAERALGTLLTLQVAECDSPEGSRAVPVASGRATMAEAVSA